MSGETSSEIKCEQCGITFTTLQDKVKHRYKGKFYCDACYRRIKAEELENKNRTISFKMSKFGRGFTIPKE
jgi:protein-arginine kinase activator protein McsA